jgi:hypothetical protein
MTNRSTQKADERAILDRFLQLRPELLNGAQIRLGQENVRPGASEPDFVASFPDGRIVGIEIVEMFDQPTRQRIEAHKKLKEALRGRLTATKGFLPLFVHLDVEDWRALIENEKRIPALADRLAKLITTTSTTVVVERHLEREVLDAAGIGELVDVRISPSEKLLIGASLTFLGPNLSVVEQLINKKTEKLASYRDVLPPGSDIWLVIAAGFSPPSIHWTKDVERVAAAPKFERAFVVDDADGAVREMRAARK